MNNKSRVIVSNISNYLHENHHIYRQFQKSYCVSIMRDCVKYRRRFSLLKDAIDYRDIFIKQSPTPQSRGRAKGGNTKDFHPMFCISIEESEVFRVILQTENGKIRKSFIDIEDARQWRDNEIRDRGVIDAGKSKIDIVQSYSDISDKSNVFADSDNIRDKLDNIIFDDWEEMQ